MCETLAEHTADHPDGAFMVGLLSVAEALVEGPLADTLAELPLDPEIAKAILEREGVLGELLAHVIAYEQGDFPETGPATALDRQTTQAYIEAIKWSSELLAAIPD
jgi:EAL and modified HD-GYP domain-containing signal transduction protein